MAVLAKYYTLSIPKLTAKGLEFHIEGVKTWTKMIPNPGSSNNSNSNNTLCSSNNNGASSNTNNNPANNSSTPEPLWKQCVSWLCRLEVLPDNHCITGSSASIQDLAYALRDGVLLCHVIQIMDPGSVDMRNVNQRPQNAQFLCLKNIRVFLNSCRDSFGLKETDLFQPSMLYDFSDFARVLYTLSILSKSLKALEKDPLGFAQTAVCPSSSYEEEQIYRTLEDIINEDKYQEFYFKHHGAAGKSHYYSGEDDKEEGIYQDLCSLQSLKIRAELNIQPKEKRDYCIKEIIETESNYVDVLNMLRKNFIKTITKMRDTDKKIIFMNIIELGDTHAGFYQNLCDVIRGKSCKKIGEVFLEYKTRFLKYGEYCSCLPKSQDVLDNVMKDESVREEIALYEKSVKDGKFRLRDLLAVPMQRILKYHLLLKGLLDTTKPTHEEYRIIQQAYESMLDVSDYINEVKRDSEQLHIIKEIEASINDWNMPDGYELKDYGRLRKDGELKVHSHDSHAGKTKLRFVFIFDKVMLMCKPARGDHYSYKDSLKLADYKVQDERPPMSTKSRDSSNRWAHSFLLVHNKSLNAYTLTARTEEDKNKWIQAVREALDNIYPLQLTIPNNHRALMTTLERPANCEVCYKLLKGLFYQGYHCEKCGKFMHKSCLTQSGNKCGIGPPLLPPRPVSVQLPKSLQRIASASSTEDSVSLVFPRQSSTNSLRIPPPPPSVPPPSCTSSVSSLVSMNGNNKDYINTQMEDHPWYVDDVDRDLANLKLADYPTSTFLVRRRAQGGFALSVKTSEGDVKHMKILSNSDDETYFLSDQITFRSIVELVNFYSRNSLKESFHGLNLKLRFPVGELSIVVALYDFEPSPEGPEENNKLALKKGQRVIVIDKNSTQLWWTAFDGNATGYIPKNYVSEHLDDDH
ncbi:protein vav isoform X3 [Lepeophtheirus salmonis]|uniref:protein vav isoform X3 n=1 Tax=Lepeophtheirus salmonis TaxID=72036 RepID=UPI001AEB412D|nr:protein vav-like isoform X3 [Lepeophtheirus salmonis]